MYVAAITTMETFQSDIDDVKEDVQELKTGMKNIQKMLQQLITPTVTTTVSTEPLGPTYSTSGTHGSDGRY
jgi:DNA-directed RNA polymerase alpha subunit